MQVGQRAGRPEAQVGLDPHGYWAQGCVSGYLTNECIVTSLATEVAWLAASEVPWHKIGPYMGRGKQMGPGMHAKNQ